MQSMRHVEGTPKVRKRDTVSLGTQFGHPCYRHLYKLYSRLHVRGYVVIETLYIERGYIILENTGRLRTLFT